MGSSSDIEIVEPNPSSRPTLSNRRVPTSTANDPTSPPPTSAVPTSSRSSLEPSNRARSRRPGMSASISEEQPASAGGPKRPVKKNTAKRPTPHSRRASSEEADDLFILSKPNPSKPTRKFGVGGSAAAVAPPVLSSSSASDHSDSSEPEDNARVAPKALKLPTWTRPMTGAEKKILEKGVVKNRKKKQKGESGSDEEDLKVKLAEREKQKKNKKKDPSPPLAPGDKGKGKAKVYRLSDESDEDDSDGSAAEPKGDSKKRPRSKSRSLTPPEPMDDFSLQSFLTKYRANVAPKAQVDGGSDGDSSNSLINVDNISGSDDVQIMTSAGPPQPEEPESIVEIRVSMVWDPDKEVKNERAKDHYCRWVKYELGYTKPFRHIYEQVAAARGIEEPDLYMTYDDRLVYRFGNPATLKLIATGDFKCYTKEVYMKLEQNKTARMEARAGRRARGEDDDEDSLPPVSREPSRALGRAAEAVRAGGGGDESDDEARGSLISITIRGSPTMELSIAVKPSTTIASLLRRYCRKHEIAPERAVRMWIEYEGEKLDAALALSTYDDIESEDTVDVREAK